MSRHDLTDEEWRAIQPYLPRERSGQPGRPWISHRQVINGILWVLAVGCGWRDMPPEFGKWQTVYNRFRRWRNDKLWDRVHRGLVRFNDRQKKVDRSLWCVDGSVVRAHRVAAGASGQHAPGSAENAHDKHALGRSRGGFSTKLHVVTDAAGLPLAITVTPGQNHEAPEFPNVMDQLVVSLYRKEKRPAAIAGDKGYNSAKIRDWLKRRDITAVIPTKSNQISQTDFNQHLYRQRNIVERVIGWLKENRRVATRYDKRADSYLAMVKLAAIRLILKRQLRDTA